MRDILLIQLGRLGDLVQTLPLVQALKAGHPQVRVTLMCLADFRAILEDFRGVDRVIPVRIQDTDALVEPERRAAFPQAPPFDAFPELAEEYDLAVTLNPDQGSAVILEKVKAGTKSGRVATERGELRLLGPWAKYLFAMVSHRRQNLFNIVDIHKGMAGIAPSALSPCLRVPAARGEAARAVLRAEGWRGERPLVALQAGSSDPHRAWDLENFAALAGRLLDDGATVVLLGDSRETGMAEGIRAKVGRPLLDMVGKTRLPDLPALLAMCDLLVSNDTGTVHVAAAVGLPTLTLMFATAYYTESAPYGAGHAVLQAEIACSPCSTSTRCPVQLCRGSLTVEAVHAAARWRLRPGSDPPPPSPGAEVYLSRFQGNGTLLYAPARGPGAPAHFQTGHFHRRLWEEALGLPTEPEGAAAWPLQAAAGEGAETRERFAGSLAALSEPLARGRELAERLRLAFAEGKPELIHPLHGQLARLGESLHALASRSGPVGDFLRFELMDLDYVEYPELAGRLEGKYRAMSGLVDRIRAALAAA